MTTPRQLRVLYKRFKHGLVDEKDMTEREKRLLVKYYGVKFENE